MSQKTDAVVASTIGIDTGKNTLHLIGLDDQGTIVLRKDATIGPWIHGRPSPVLKYSFNL